MDETFDDCCASLISLSHLEICEAGGRVGEWAKKSAFQQGNRKSRYPNPKQKINPVKKSTFSLSLSRLIVIFRIIAFAGSTFSIFIDKMLHSRLKYIHFWRFSLLFSDAKAQQTHNLCIHAFRKVTTSSGVHVTIFSQGLYQFGRENKKKMSIKELELLFLSMNASDFVISAASMSFT